MFRKSRVIFFLLLVAGALAYYLYHKPNYASGDKAADFVMDIDGRELSLSSLRGNYILLDFWGSWCPPCLKEVPDLVSLYTDYHDKKYTSADNFEIVSIGIETGAERWKSAIERMGMVWPYHYSDFKRFKSPIALDYGVRSIPTKFLIDPQGNILSVNPSIASIRKLLRSKLQ